MSGDALDLSGSWQGIYNFPDDTPPVAFEAEIRDSGGALVGTIREVVDYVDGDVALEATIDGAREGLQVHFTKYYDAGHEDYDIVLYSGEVRDDGREIQGDWNIPGDWSGSFIMIRAAGKQADVSQQVSETVR